jgi:hypothetical protein
MSCSAYCERSRSKAVRTQASDRKSPLCSQKRKPREPTSSLSRRRDDSVYIADRVDQHLRSRFGPEAIFRDTRSIDYGDEFAPKIDDVLARTRVCLLIIGGRWRGQLPDGHSRIGQLDDWVRREVGSALIVASR